MQTYSDKRGWPDEKTAIVEIKKSCEEITKEMDKRFAQGNQQ